MMRELKTLFKRWMFGTFCPRIIFFYINIYQLVPDLDLYLSLINDLYCIRYVDGLGSLLLAADIFYYDIKHASGY